jgi:UDP-N-acetylmuramoyl-L-alanyl-D-glutamate--2,6-diaminopimelate ligase
MIIDEILVGVSNGVKIRKLMKSIDYLNKYSNLEDFEVRGISCNSKQVLDNFIFVAIKGVREDGSKFIDEAINRGAKAVIFQGQGARGKGQDTINFIRVKDARRALSKLATEFYGNPSAKIKVVGITGTNGKTTVSYLIEALLKDTEALPSVIGTINYRFKDKVAQSKNTTPGPIELQSMLAEMQEEGINYCIMEVSSHALDQGRTEGINFHSAIFTNLTQDHLDYHRTFKNYFNAKAKLFKNINANAFAVINNDDRCADRIKKLTNAKIVAYGIENNADITATNIKFSSTHTEFILTAPKLKTNFKTRLFGRHNVYNILAAVAWAIEEGIDIAAVKSSIEGFSFVPGRLERIDSGRGFSVFVDYAHTEDALKNIIQALRCLSARRIIVVFGCGGERDKTKRPKMGKVAIELSDYAIITNDNPRSEDPKDIIRDIKRGIRKSNFCVIPKRRDAIKKSLSLAEAGDIVLVAGKGHEDYQIIKDRIMHFDDREVVRECLQSMNY